MRAILLAAGLGTRLRPLTETVPKCLVPVGDEVLLDTWLRRLSEAGVERVLVNLHHLADVVRRHVAASPWSDLVEFADEPELLGTAGTLVANKPFLQGRDGLLVHADNWCTASLGAFIAAHHGRPAGCTMTMMTFETRHPRECGIVTTDPRGVMVGFDEKPERPVGTTANAAIYVLSPELYAPLAGVSDFSTEVVARSLGKVFTWPADGELVDIGTPERYGALVARLAGG
jgi:mannose-1-phosphate guanylyltransferase